MSSVELYQRILDAVEFYEYLGLTYVEDGDVCRLQVPEADRLRTPIGHVHGGVLTSLIDMAGLYAVWLEYGMPGGEAYTTSMDVSFENSTAQAVTAHAQILDDAGGDEIAVAVTVYELPATHEFGTPYSPGTGSAQTVATSHLEFVVPAEQTPAPDA